VSEINGSHYANKKTKFATGVIGKKRQIGARGGRLLKQTRYLRLQKRTENYLQFLAEALAQYSSVDMR
jgi:hypothetical protein